MNVYCTAFQNNEFNQMTLCLQIVLCAIGFCHSLNDNQDRN